ncbi:MAG: pyridoxal 5'-phosphate synthase, partial [Flavobacteriales bacterium]
RIRGTVERLSAEESDRYFNSRPRPSRIGAWASQQSESIADRQALEAARAEVEARFPGDVPRPPHWGGYRLVSDAIEFWQGRPGRLHDRIRCTRQGESWIQERLQP